MPTGADAKAIEVARSIVLAADTAPSLRLADCRSSGEGTRKQYSRRGEGGMHGDDGWMWHDGWGWGGWALMVFAMVLVLAAILTVVVLV